MVSESGLRALSHLDGFLHHTWRELIASHTDGCTLCRLFHYLILQQYPERGGGADRLIFHNLVRQRDRGINKRRLYRIDTLQCSVNNSEPIFTLYPFAEEGNPAASLVARRPFLRDVSSQRVLDAASEAVHRCRRTDNPPEGHPRCRYSRDAMLPSRVLDVGDTGASGAHIKLQINKTEIRGSYLALSYCWGSSATQPLCLLRNNIHDFESAIKVVALQRSIKDAILITRKLGFRYLWVDALCIIQDDDYDKDREISKMADIYKNAALTLFAGVAKCATEGFLERPGVQQHAYLPDLRFTFPMRNGEVGTMYLASEPYIPNHALDERGWAMQEYMLSSRMLIFSTYEILWQCQEVDLQSVTGNLSGIEYEQSLQSLPWTVFDNVGDPRYGSLDIDKVDLWKTVIHQYTDRQLRQPGDRLRAVSGVVSELEKLWRDSTIHGHWKQWFIQLLSWYKPDVDRIQRRFLERAPSWSWVSVDGSIRYEHLLTREDARVKILTFTQVVLEGLVLAPDEFEDSDRDSVQYRPDLVCASMEKELGDEEFYYFLLGEVKSGDGSSWGLGLLMLPISDSLFRRVGLAVFRDMSIWTSVKRQEVHFEPKTH